MVLGGGTFSTGGYSQAMTSTLTLQDNSAIDLGVGSTTSVLSFGDSSGATWTAGKTLTVEDWSGVLTGGGNEKLVFGSSNSALTGSQLAEIQFLNPAGLALGTYTAQILSAGEIVPGGAGAGHAGALGRGSDRPAGLRLAEAEID